MINRSQHILAVLRDRCAAKSGSYRSGSGWEGHDRGSLRRPVRSMGANTGLCLPLPGLPQSARQPPVASYSGRTGRPTDKSKGWDLSRPAAGNVSARRRRRTERAQSWASGMYFWASGMHLRQLLPEQKVRQATQCVCPPVGYVSQSWPPCYPANVQPTIDLDQTWFCFAALYNGFSNR